MPAFQRVGPLLARFPRQRPAVTTQTPEKLEPEPLRWEVWHPSELDIPDVPTFDPFAHDAANEHNWSNILPCDFANLTVHRCIVAPCPWSRGHLHHARACVDLQLAWEVEMPFGECKGKRLSTISKGFSTKVLAPRGDLGSSPGAPGGATAVAIGVFLRGEENPGAVSKFVGGELAASAGRPVRR